MTDRGTGRTTLQMQTAPAGATFVWCNKDLSYPRALAERLGRTDLKFLTPRALEMDAMRGLRMPIVVDHAFWEYATPRQREALNAALEANTLVFDGGTYAVPSDRQPGDTGRVLDPKPAETEEPLLQFFEYLHLPPHLQDASQPFCVLAETIVRTLPRNSERTVALRKLLEAKDCAVRAALMR